MRPLPITALVLTKNEERAISGCLASLWAFDQVVVVDSGSTDRTVEVAEAMGVETVQFSWNGRYPKKKQWAADHPAVRNDWVLHVDADERVTADLEHELRLLFAGGHEAVPFAALDIVLDYHFAGNPLRHGHRVTKRSLVHRQRAAFPEVGDLGLPGTNEVEGHYQPQSHGAPVASMQARLTHDDPDPIGSWIARHNFYSDGEAAMRQKSGLKDEIAAARSRQGRLFAAVPFKPLAFFGYSYLARGGWRDGRPGFDYAFALSWYYWLVGVKTRELKATATPPEAQR